MGLVLEKTDAMSDVARRTAHYTYRDYATWPDEERWELIDGVAYNMTLAPSTMHQTVVTNLSGILFALLRNHSCRLFVSPIDVLLPLGEEVDDDVDSTVQPDIVVVCRPDIIGPKHIRGTPDWIIEVLSPTTAQKDEGIKRDRYQRAGVAEYWLVHPTDRIVMRYRLLPDNTYGLPEIFGDDDRIDLPIAQGGEIALAEVFATATPSATPNP